MAPLILGMIAGFIAFGELYVPLEGYRHLYELLRDFAQILAAGAFILGALNLAQVNYPKIRRKERDWQFKVLMLGAALVMGLAGIQWHAIGGERASGSAKLVAAAGAGAGGLTVVPDPAHREAVIAIDGKPPERIWYSSDPTDLWTSPGDKRLQAVLERGPHEIVVSMPVSGYRSYTVSIGKELPLRTDTLGGLAASVASAGGAISRQALPPGIFLHQKNDAHFFTVDEVFGGGAARLDLHTDLVQIWGAGTPEGRVFTWFYDHIFFPCNATMFALLAFFIASAAFRAFRARNVESALLLGAAILVMLGLVPIGRVISPMFPDIADWILEIPNNAGRRAILMGAALGGIVTGLRVILGLERSHLGADS